MSFRKYLPSELLSDSIDYFYTMKINRHKIKTERLLPNGSFALILNYGSPIYTLDEDSFINSPDICVNKMHKKGFFVRQYPIIDIIGVAFKPGMIFNFTSVPISTFDIKYSTADTIFGNEINLLYKVIAKIKKEEDKIMLLEEFVLEKLSDKKPILNQLTLVVNKIIKRMVFLRCQI